jgi:cytoskeletal protein CcmA (bactofilin family)
MFFKKSNRVQNSIETLIGADTSIDGDINFSGGLRIDGAIHGNVTEPNANPSTLILSEHGSIEGSVESSKIVINGKVIGTVKAHEYIELQAKSHITGDVYYKSIEMHIGAVIEGKLVYLAESSAVILAETD